MKRLFLSVLVFVLALPVHAAGVDSEAEQRIRARLQGLVPQAPDAILPTELDGLYEVVFGPKSYFMSADGKYLIEGDIIDLDRRESITEDRKRQARLPILQGINVADTIVYPAVGETKHVVTVFTDIDCGYCRRLHSGMQAMNEMGIEIRYLAFPRAGVGSSSYQKAVSVWCSEDRNAAMDRAKQSQPVETRNCDHPVDEHLALVEQLGITGTPALFFSDGTHIPGYMPPDKLLAELERR